MLDLISRIVGLQLFYVEDENRDERGIAQNIPNAQDIDAQTSRRSQFFAAAQPVFSRSLV
ncbi:MAG TPA: hypothetical protein V6D48_25275 [Oculatellaceae cyanobacterium]